MATSKRSRNSQKPNTPTSQLAPDVDALLRSFGDNPEAPSIHASSVVLLGSPVDFALIVAQLDTTSEGVKMKKVATLFFSPGHLKQLAQILTTRISEYEAQFGPVAPKNL